jgi:hypothetical protein
MLEDSYSPPAQSDELTEVAVSDVSMMTPLTPS